MCHSWVSMLYFTEAMWLAVTSMWQPLVVIISESYIAHYSDVIMGAIASQITSLTIAYSIVYSGGDQREHQSSASLCAFVRGIHRWPVNSPAQMTTNRENVFIWWRLHATWNLQAEVFGKSFNSNKKGLSVINIVYEIEAHINQQNRNVI